MCVRRSARVLQTVHEGVRAGDEWLQELAGKQHTYAADDTGGYTVHSLDAACPAQAVLVLKEGAQVPL